MILFLRIFNLQSESREQRSNSDVCSPYLVGNGYIPKSLYEDKENSLDDKFKRVSIDNVDLTK